VFRKVFDAPSIDAVFDRKHNSLNLIRLVLAAVVVVSHWWPLGGYGGLVHYGSSELGSIAVDAFFVVSGFLICGSRLVLGTGRFLWHRFLRIFPAFWVCLVLTAFGFGLIGWLRGHSGLAGYLTTAGHGPFGYVINNLTLDMRVWDILGTPSHVPSPAVWDRSLWTLRWEFLCYLVIGLLGLVGVPRRRRLMLGLGGLLWAAYLLHAQASSVAPELFRHQQSVSRFSLMFLSGALFYLYRDRIPASGVLAAAAAAVVAGGYWYSHPELIVGPPLAYLCVWLAARVPMPAVLGRNDFSYGLYIYAMPVQQLLAIYGVHRWGAAAYLALSLVGVAPFAVGSWFLVERRALALKNVQLGRRPAPALRGLVPAQADGEAPGVSSEAAGPGGP
jgi:peptidoglycan/LPS O-acetylase OafA/YrhL